MPHALRSVDVTRVTRDGGLSRRRDSAAVEAPLEVRLSQQPFAVIMRTPGADVDLAAGFLFSEGVIAHADDLRELSPGADVGDVADGAGAIDVTLADHLAGDVESLMRGRRNVMANASCGVCGRPSMESIVVHAPAIDSSWSLPSRHIGAMPARLRDAQALFDETGGLHAAGLFDADLGLDAFAEDVGRHNAVDKVVGRMLLQRRLPLGDRALFVSGRSSYEIVQKAWLAGVPIVASVSAPSSLAIDLADRACITLVGFVRDGDFNVYTHAHRVRV